MNLLIALPIMLACMVWSVVVWCWKAFILLIVIPLVFIVVFIYHLPNSILEALKESQQ